MSDLVICKFRKSMVIYDAECAYWDQVSLNNTNQPTNFFVHIIKCLCTSRWAAGTYIPYLCNADATGAAVIPRWNQKDVSWALFNGLPDEYLFDFTVIMLKHTFIVI